MKLKNVFKLIALGSVLAMTAVGCKTHSLFPTPLPKNGGGAHDPGPDSGLTLNNGNNLGSTSTTGIALGQGHPGWGEDPSMPLKAQTVYFDYDKSAIKSSEQPKLEDVANYLKSHADVALKVEGNCDERGTEEYNRSLGERRALSAREYLVRLGIDANRIDTLSYGADKPAESGHSESAWSRNRRDDFVVLMPPKP